MSALETDLLGAAPADPKGRGMGSHQSGRMENDEHLTPPSILLPLGPFDLDPCAPIRRPWDTARKHYTRENDGLLQQWSGRVWLNPPYGRETDRWLARLAGHGDGIALIFARTETKPWFDWVWSHADAVLFIRERLTFYSVTGERRQFNGGAPSVLIAYGESNARCLAKVAIPGAFVPLKARVSAAYHVR